MRCLAFSDYHENRLVDIRREVEVCSFKKIMSMLNTFKPSLMALVATVALCANAQQVLPEPLVQAVRKAVQGNPEVQARWYGFLAAGDEREVARGGYFPQVDLRASSGRESRVSPLVGDVGRYSFNTTQLSLNQMLFDGLFTPNEVKRLGQARLTRYYELLDASETAALEAVRAYADVVRYRELVEAATQNYAEIKQSSQQVEERARGGVGRGADVEQASGRLALAESNLLTELTNLHDVSARYLRIVGEKAPTNPASLPDPFQLGAMPASSDALLRDGLQGSPALNAAVENARSYATAIESRKSAYLPRVDVRAYASRENDTGGTPGNTRVNGVELLLNYNLFRGGSDKARERQAVDQSAQARALQDKVCRDVRQTLSIAYSDVRSLSEQRAYLDQHRLATEKSREAYRQQFDIGQRTLLDLLDSQNEYFEATRAYINAHYNQVTAQARTLSGMGKLVTALGVGRSDLPSLQEISQDRAALTPDDLCPFESPTLVEVVKPAPKKKTGSYVVLLPSPDGSVGRVVVQGQGGEQELTQAQQATALDGDMTPFAVNKSQLQRDFGAAMAARPPLPEQFLLYFQLGSAKLTPASESMLPKVLERLSARKVPDISVVGHTDTLGKATTNDALGLKRANAIAQQIRSRGLDNVEVTVESRGKRNPLVTTPDETAEPRNRRVEITVR